MASTPASILNDMRLSKISLLSLMVLLYLTFVNLMNLNDIMRPCLSLSQTLLLQL